MRKAPPVKKIKAIYFITTIAIGFLTPAWGQNATELYLPLGRSPGVSAKLSLIAMIAEVNSQDQALTVTSASGAHTIYISEYTQIFIDNSTLRQPNRYGTFSDFKAGMLVEVRFEADKSHRPAQWIKLQIPFLNPSRQAPRSWRPIVRSAAARPGCRPSPLL